MTDALAPFDALYRDSSDPWGTTTRWYERRKRSLLLAALPHEHYGSIYEAGCGTGHISAALAARCDALTASDGSPVALAVAAEAVAACSNVSLVVHRLPDDWPERAFDLVVLSEVLYFVDGPARQRIAAAARTSVGATGTVIACDWRDPIEGLGLTGEQVHRDFAASLDLPALFEYGDADFVLTGWSADATPVATRDGLRR